MSKLPPPMNLKIASQATTSRSDPKPVLSMSKTWVVPERAKPGRKKNNAGSTENDEAEAKKAAQKALKEKKAEHLKELEDKVKQLEKQLIQQARESATYYSEQIQIAQEESTNLKAENEGLRLLVGDLEDQLGGYRRLDVNSGRGNGRRPPTDQPEDLPNSKRSRSSYMYDNNLNAQDTPSPLSSASIDEEEDDDEQTGIACGLCTTHSSCLCSENGLKMDHSITPISNDNSPTTTALEDYLAQSNYDTPLIQPISNSIALPLRSKNVSGTKPSIWHLDPPAPMSPPVDTKASCSGNPASCPACQNDPFGKAFCASLSDSVCSNNPCDSCPSKLPLPSPDIFEKTLADLPCCGAPELCGSLTCTPKDNDIMLPLSVPIGVRETVPCNEAWAALKQHPNIAFANLQMLADVVSKRTFCDGPALLPSASSYMPSSYKTANPSTQRLTVEKSAVNDALDILDRAGGRGGSLRK